MTFKETKGLNHKIKSYTKAKNNSLIFLRGDTMDTSAKLSNKRYDFSEHPAHAFTQSFTAQYIKVTLWVRFDKCLIFFEETLYFRMLGYCRIQLQGYQRTIIQNKILQVRRGGGGFISQDILRERNAFLLLQCAMASYFMNVINKNLFTFSHMNPFCQYYCYYYLEHFSTVIGPNEK